MEELEIPKCECCGYESDKGDVNFTYDPYAQEIHDELIELWMCDDCYREHCDDV